MCTIIISAGRVPHEHTEPWRRFMIEAGTAAESQGHGAAGLMGEFDTEYVAWKKRPVPCGQFLEDTLIKGRVPHLLGVHARSGANYPDDRAYDKHHHPFHGKHVMLMHEGYAHENWFPLAERLGVELDTNTDSELLMWLVDSQPTVLEGVRHAFKVLDDWTIGTAIYDERTPGKIYFASKSRRCSPYHIIRSRVFNTATLISRFGMIRDSYSDTLLRKLGFGDVENVEPDKLYTFEADGSFSVQDI